LDDLLFVYCNANLLKQTKMCSEWQKWRSQFIRNRTKSHEIARNRTKSQIVRNSWSYEIADLTKSQIARNRVSGSSIRTAFAPSELPAVNASSGIVSPDAAATACRSRRNPRDIRFRHVVRLLLQMLSRNRGKRLLLRDQANIMNHFVNPPPK
jgi:hypothetical protein